MNVTKKRLHALFEAGVFVKAVDSVVEFALGVFFLSLSPQTVNEIILFIFGDELTEQPRDTVWHFLFHGWNGISGDAQFFWAVIFLAHGIAKMFLVWGLWKKKLWVYPAAAITFGCFALYQIYRITYEPSLILALLTIFDILFIVLIAEEYHYQRHVRNSPA